LIRVFASLRPSSSSQSMRHAWADLMSGNSLQSSVSLSRLSLRLGRGGQWRASLDVEQAALLREALVAEEGVGESLVIEGRRLAQRRHLHVGEKADVAGQQAGLTVAVYEQGQFWRPARIAFHTGLRPKRQREVHQLQGPLHAGVGDLDV